MLPIASLVDQSFTGWKLDHLMNRLAVGWLILPICEVLSVMVGISASIVQPVCVVIGQQRIFQRTYSTAVRELVMVRIRREYPNNSDLEYNKVGSTVIIGMDEYSIDTYSLCLIEGPSI